jgi:inosine-uridine nucleoside N-ribohydrolase
VLALGPLTSLAPALGDAKRNIGADVPRVVVMGGRRRDGGVSSDRGEFNFAFDVASAEAVLSCGRGVTVVPIDVTERVTFTERDVSRLRRTANNALVADLLSWMARTHPASPDGRGFAVHDAVALMLLISPELGETSQRPFSIWASGERAGELRPYDGEREAVDCVVDCDVGRIKAGLLELWAATPADPRDVYDTPRTDVALQPADEGAAHAPE